MCEQLNLRSKMKSTKTELLDGPTGTELERRGFRLEGPLWSADAVERAPDLLRQIHADYLDAGATIVTANTFRTNRASVVSVGRASFDAGALTRKAVKIAREALKSSSRPQSARIAGSLAPVGDCYTPSDSRSDGFVRDDHRAHLEALIDAECDILLIETMNSLPEAIVAAEEADRLGAPFLLSIVTDRSGRRMLDGTDLSMAVQTLSQFRPEAILANCSSPQAVAEGVRVFRSVKEEGGFAWGMVAIRTVEIQIR